MSLKNVKEKILGKGKKRKKRKTKPKGQLRAKDFGDNPDIRRGRDAATVAMNEPWEVAYLKKKRKAKKKKSKKK